MASKPSSLPQWNSGGANRTEPSGGKKILGYTTNDVPTSGNLNWWKNLVYQWMQYLDTVEATLAGLNWYWTGTHEFVPGTTDATAIHAYANGAGAGVIGEATTTAGSAGVVGLSTTRTGVYGTTTSGSAVSGAASTTGYGVGGHTVDGLGVFGEATGTGFAVGVGAGHMKFYGTNPSASTGFSNVLTPTNVPKAWGTVTVSGGAITGGTSDGFNCTFSFGTSGGGANAIVVTFGTAMANTKYAVVVGTDDDPNRQCYAVDKTTGGFKIVSFYTATAPANNDYTGGALQVDFTVFARQ